MISIKGRKTLKKLVFRLKWLLLSYCVYGKEALEAVEGKELANLIGERECRGVFCRVKVKEIKSRVELTCWTRLQQ